jgi:hypothetical protein
MNRILNTVSIGFIAWRDLRGQRAQWHKIAAGRRDGLGGFEGLIHGERYFHMRLDDDTCYYHAPGISAQVIPKESKKSGDQLRKKVVPSLADPRKSIAASDVFKRLRAAMLKR